MPYNGSGAYEAPANSWNPAVGGTTISSADWNSLLADLETALSSVITKDGQTVITANLPMAGFKHTGVNTNSGATSRSEYASGATLQDGAPLDAGYTGGTSTAFTASLTPAIAAYADKQSFRVIFNAATGATPTINFNSVGAKKIYWNNNGSTTQITTNDIPINYPAILRYDTTLDGAAGAFWLMNPRGAVASGSITPLEMAASAVGCPLNFGLVSSVGSSALTVAVKGEDGNDPSATNVVKIPFQDQAGNYDVLSITSATSIVVSSGSTLGTVNGVKRRLWIVGFNDSGTFRLGIVNCYIGLGNIFPLIPYNTYSSTAEGGAGAADSAGVIYTGTAVSTKPMVVLGFIEISEATAGTWASAATRVMIWKPFMPLPGQELPERYAEFTGVQTMSSATFANITNLAIAVTPTSDCNVFKMFAEVQYGSNTGANYPCFRFCKDGTTAIHVGDAASSRIRVSVGTGAVVSNSTMATAASKAWDAPATTSSTTYSFQIAAGAGGGAAAVYVNQSATDTDSATFNRAASSLSVIEVMT